jgi:hypothetical protein
MASGEEYLEDVPLKASPVAADSFYLRDSEDSDLTARATITSLITLLAATFSSRANNLSDLTNAATARTNLSLGTAALLNLSSNLQSINDAQATRLANLNQDLTTTSDAQFNDLGLLGGLTVGGNITVTGTVDGTDVSLYQNLTAAEISQIENINTTVITGPNWTRLSNLDQDVDTASSVSFNGISTTTSANIGTSASIGTNLDVTGTAAFDGHALVLAYKSSTTANLTGDGTSYTVIYDSEVVDVGSDFNTTTGVFTAPTTGKYQVNARVKFDTVAAGHTFGIMTINTSNRTYVEDIPNPANSRNSSNDFTYNMSQIVDMDASDTLSISVNIFNSTKTIGITGHATQNPTAISIYLLTRT